MKTLFALILVFLAVCDLRAAENYGRPATMIFRARMEYPLEARQRKMEGAGTYVLYIDKRGLVTVVRVGISSGHKLLDQTAIKALLKCRFKPGTVPRIRIPVRWSLSDRVP